MLRRGLLLACRHAPRFSAANMYNAGGVGMKDESLSSLLQALPCGNAYI